MGQYTHENFTKIIVDGVDSTFETIEAAQDGVGIEDLNVAVMVIARINDAITRAAIAWPELRELDNKDINASTDEVRAAFKRHVSDPKKIDWLARMYKVTLTTWDLSVEAKEVWARKDSQPNKSVA